MFFLAAQSKFTTSLRFTQTDVTAIKIDVTQQKIVHLYQQPLPVGFIAKGEIINLPAVTAVVKTALTQTRSFNQEIAIGLPEDRILFATSDSQGIPKDKLAEAMKWQAAEIFLGESDKLYIDWQLTTPNHPGKVLFAAAPRNVVDKFIQATQQGGGKPVSCESTSLSLAKLLPQGETALVVEIRPAISTLVTIDTANSVHFSTIVNNANQLIEETRRLLAFQEQKYHTKPTKIYLCGEGATSDWLSFMANQVQIPTYFLPLPRITNLPQAPSRFAVSLALNNTSLMPPSFPNTINLLPPQLETEQSRQQEKQQLSFGFKASIVTTIITAVIMVAAFIRVQMGLASLRTQITAEEQASKATAYDQLAKQAENANSLARQLQRLPKKDNLASTITSLHKAVPASVSLSGYTINLPQKAMVVDGFSPTRDLLLTFKKNLEAQPEFDLVNIPLSTLEDKNNVEFSILVKLATKKSP